MEPRICSDCGGLRGWFHACTGYRPTQPTNPIEPPPTMPNELPPLRRTTDWPQVSAQQAPAPMSTPGYEPLRDVLIAAYNQASHGKGNERHAQGQPFDQQPMQKLIALYGVGFALGQAAKKSQESQRLPRDRAIAELLGAINYLAGAVIALQSQPTTNESKPCN